METIRKIVAIGGGDSGRVRPDGTREAYETQAIDREIVRLTGKEHPHFLYLAHSMITPDGEKERTAFDTACAVFGGRFGCECRQLLSADVEADANAAAEAIAWADIVYEAGGNTFAMLNFWRDHGLDALLRRAWEDGKVMCGASAGAICWFSGGNTDHPAFINRPVNRIPALGLIDAYFAPHADNPGKRESVNRSLRRLGGVGISVSNCCALEIVGDGWRVIPGDGSARGLEPYVLKTTCAGGTLREEKLPVTPELQPLDALIGK